MSRVDIMADQLKATGIYGATQVDADTIHKILNMAEFEYYDLEISVLESYLGLLAQQIYFLQQEINLAEAKEIEAGNRFKMQALPEVIGSKIRSVEERWLYASTLNEDLYVQFNLWQDSIIDATLKKDLSDPLREKLQVLKRLYDDRRMEGRNKNLHKYVDEQR